MKVFAALLKGVNVGAKNRVKMDDLIQVFESLGFLSVQTYIQSGNVLFKSGEEEAVLRTKIKQGIEASFGFYTPVLLRGADELETALNSFPFRKTDSPGDAGAQTLYIALLSTAPAPEAIKRFAAYKKGKEEFLILERDVFLCLPDGVRGSKLAGHLHLLDKSATLRNLNTLAALASMAKKMAE